MLVQLGVVLVIMRGDDDDDDDDVYHLLPQPTRQKGSRYV